MFNIKPIVGHIHFTVITVLRTVVNDETRYSVDSPSIWKYFQFLDACYFYNISVSILWQFTYIASKVYEDSQ
jgi:hypothetical protein